MRTRAEGVYAGDAEKQADLLRVPVSPRLRDPC